MSMSCSVITWCLALVLSANASIEGRPPAVRIAEALTGIPPFSDTTNRFRSSPTAMTFAAGTHRFTVRNPSRSK
jgi:hypothetical protein